MIQAFYSAASGMQGQQRNMEVSSNNIANLQTVGFKKSRASFSDLTYTSLKAPEAGKVGVQLGSGSKVDSINRNFIQGTLYSTDNPMDLAIEGKGFFVVDNGSGEHYYTRDGNFKTSIEPQGAYMVSARGDYLLDTDGNRIQLPLQSESIEIDSTGLIQGSGMPNIRIGLVNFQNPEGLEAVGGNLYRQTPASDAPGQEGTGSIRQHYLESSNVDLLDEITALMRTQRIFQLNSKVVQTADEMEGTANNLRT